MDFASLEPLAGGWSGETFVARLDDGAGGQRQVVRIHARRPERAEVDAALLRLVRGLVPVPEVLDVRPAEGDLPALLITSFLPGERGDLVLPRLGAAEQGVLGRAVGRLAATLAAMPQLRPGAFVDRDLTVAPWDLPSSLGEAALGALEDGFAHWTPRERDGLVAVADLADQVLASVDRTSLVHSDLNPKNLLVDPETLAVTGLVDWEFAHAGHPFTDLGNVLRFDRAPAYVAAVLDSFGELREVPQQDATTLARAADLWALLDLAGRAGQNPVADRAEARLRLVAGSGDLHVAE